MFLAEQKIRLWSARTWSIVQGYHRAHLHFLHWARRPVGQNQRIRHFRSLVATCSSWVHLYGNAVGIPSCVPCFHLGPCLWLEDRRGNVSKMSRNARQRPAEKIHWVIHRGQQHPSNCRAQRGKWCAQWGKSEGKKSRLCAHSPRDQCRPGQFGHGGSHGDALQTSIVCRHAELGSQKEPDRHSIFF